MHAHERHGGVENDDPNHTEQQAAGKVAPWVSHLSGDEAGGLPAPIGKHDRVRAAPTAARLTDEGPDRVTWGMAGASYNPAITRAAIARFRTISALCVLLPERTPA
jgi:hypothetical protein